MSAEMYLIDPNEEPTPMDPVWKEKWVAALESGEFEQGTGALRDVRGRYCCLGVLQAIDPGRQDESYWGINGVLQDPGRYGLPHPQGAVVAIDGEKGVLTQHNDGGPAYGIRPKSFKEIAAAIREQL